MSNAGYATLSVIPSFDGMQRRLATGLDGPMTAAGRTSGGKFGQHAGREASRRFGTTFKVGATLAGAMALREGVQLMKESTREASDLGESLNAINVTYGKQAGAVKGLGREAADALGLSNTEFNNLAIRFQGFADTVAGGNGRRVVTTLDDLTTRAADFASVMNLDVAEAAQVFQSGLAGESEPLRRFGINLSDAAVKAHAYKTGIAEAGRELSDSQKVQGRYSLLMKETADAQGDFAKTSDSAANAQRRLQANVDNLQAKLGRHLLPVVEDVTNFLVDKGVPAVSRFIDQMRDGRGPGGELAETLNSVKDATVVIAPKIADIVKSFNNMPEWARTAIIGGGGGLLAMKKLGGGKLLAAGAGGLGGGRGLGGPVPVFVTNMGPGMGGTGGKGGKGAPRIGGFGALAVGGVAAGALGNDSPDMERVKGLTEEINKLIKAGEGAFFKLVALRTEGTATFDDIAGSVARYDDIQARAIRRDPALAYSRLHVAAKEAGISFGDMLSVLPRTSGAIDRTGAAAKLAANKTGIWHRTVGDLDKGLDKVDGRNLRGPRFDITSIERGTDSVERLSGALTAAQREANRLKIGVGQLMYGGPRAAGGPVKSGTTYLVGERGPELFTASRSGRIIPNHQVTNSRSTKNETHFHGDIYVRDGRDLMHRTRRRTLGGD